MADGWNIRARRSNPDGGLDLLGCYVVRVRNAQLAEQMVRSKMPDAVVWLDSEASDVTLDSYNLVPGEVFAVLEGR